MARRSNTPDQTAQALGIVPSEPSTEGYEGLQTEQDAADYVAALKDMGATDAEVGEAVARNAEPTPNGAAVVRGGAAGTLLGYINQKAQTTEDEDEVISEAIAARILNATSLDEVLDPLGTIAGQDLLGTSLLVHGVRFMASDLAEGLPFFAVLDAQTTSDSPRKAITIGGKTVLFQLAKLDAEEAWPQMLMIVKSDKPTRKGFYPLQLRRP